MAALFGSYPSIGKRRNKMMRRDFLQVLEHDLSSLPVQAREEALAFFTEYLAEVGESVMLLLNLVIPTKLLKTCYQR